MHLFCNAVRGCDYAMHVRQRIVLKIAGLVHQSLAGRAPVYLADDCRRLSDIDRRSLRFVSSNIRMLSVPATHNRFADRSFTAAGPRLWNELSADLRRPNLTFPVEEYLVTPF